MGSKSDSVGDLLGSNFQLIIIISARRKESV